MSNKYLEKVAEHYSMKAHKDDKTLYGVDKVHLSRHDVQKYKNAEGVNPALGIGAIGAGGYAGYKTGVGAAKVYTAPMILNGIKNGVPKKQIVAAGKLAKFHGGFLGAMAGAAIAGHIANNADHNKRLANAGLSIVHGKKDND